MKKKVIIGIAALAALTVVWCVIPHPLVGSSYQSYQLDYVEYQGKRFISMMTVPERNGRKLKPCSAPISAARCPAGSHGAAMVPSV